MSTFNTMLNDNPWIGPNSSVQLQLWQAEMNWLNMSPKNINLDDDILKPLPLNFKYAKNCA